MFNATARKIFVSALGGILLLLGFAMIFLPGPGLLTMFGGLALLASEFPWARELLKKLKERLSRLAIVKSWRRKRGARSVE